MLLIALFKVNSVITRSALSGFPYYYVLYGALSPDIIYELVRDFECLSSLYDMILALGEE